jgi:hypothetical protein
MTVPVPSRGPGDLPLCDPGPGLKFQGVTNLPEEERAGFWP